MRTSDWSARCWVDMAGPRLLILDEPCAGLDPAAREHFLQFLQRLAKRKDTPTIVLATHHVEEILPAFSQTLILNEGTVFRCGKTEEVITPDLLQRLYGLKQEVVRLNGRYCPRS